MRKIALVTALAVAPLASHAASKTFDFKDPKGTNGVSLIIDAPLEPVVGWASDVTGSCTLDPQHPEKTVGTIEVGAASVTFSHVGYTNAVRGYGLNAQKYPKIICRFKKIVQGKKLSETRYVGMVLVDFTIKNVTKALTVPIDLRYFKGQAYDRDATNDGDLLVVRSKFKISRKLFGVAQEVPEELCSDEVEVGVAVVGTAGMPRRKAPKATPVSSKSDAPSALNVRIGDKEIPIAERMAFHKVRGCSVALVKDFKIQWVKHFGDTGNETRMPISEKVLFPAGQMSEPIAYTVALKLAEDKKVGLDTDIKTYLTRWRAPKPITIRQLLQNKSGLSEHKYMGYDPTAPLPSLPALLAKSTLAFEPGTDYKRAAENATALQVTLEDALKKPFPSLVEDVFGATSSLYQAFPASETYIRFARGFKEDGTPVPHGGRAYPELAASGLWTNAEDYANFVRQLMACAAGKTSTPWKLETAALAFEPFLPVRPGTEDSQGEAICFGVDERAGKRYYFRGGNTRGYYCQTWLVPEKGNALVVFTNRQLCWKFTNELRDTYFEELTR